MQRCLPYFVAEWRHPSFSVKLCPSLRSPSCLCSGKAFAWRLHLYRCRCSFAPYAYEVCTPPFIHSSYPFQQPGLHRQHHSLVYCDLDGFASGPLQVFQVQVAFCACGLDWIGIDWIGMVAACAPTSWLQSPTVDQKNALGILEWVVEVSRRSGLWEKSWVPLKLRVPLVWSRVDSAAACATELRPSETRDYS